MTLTKSRYQHRFIDNFALISIRSMYLDWYDGTKGLPLNIGQPEKHETFQQYEMKIAILKHCPTAAMWR